MSDPYNAVVDVELALKDAGAVTASAAAQVGGSNQILDLGAGELDAELVIDVSAVDVSSADESYALALQLSSTADFSSDIVEGHCIRMGAAAAHSGDAATGTGRFKVPVTNRPNGTVYRYARMFHVIGGTSPSINYTARLSEDT